MTDWPASPGEYPYPGCQCEACHEARLFQGGAAPDPLHSAACAVAEEIRRDRPRDLVTALDAFHGVAHQEVLQGRAQRAIDVAIQLIRLRAARGRTEPAECGLPIPEAAGQIT